MTESQSIDGAKRFSPNRQLDLFDDFAPRGNWLSRLAIDKHVTKQPMKVAGLFAGIGGFELGLNLAGHESVLLCENDPGANAVLDAKFPNVGRHGDVRTLSRLSADTDLIVAGFPCQDLSQAGRTAGITGKNSGLIGSIFDLLRQRAVPWLLLENVPFMLQLAKGRALAVIVDALEHLQYRWAYRIVDSRAFGLPQRRERVFLVAALEGDPRAVLLADDACAREPHPQPLSTACGFYWTEGTRGLGWAVDSVPTLKGGSTVGIPSPPAILMPTKEIVKPDIRDAERMQGFDIDWTKPAERVVKPGYRWKLVGNAVTVDVAHWIGWRLRHPSQYDGSVDLPLAKSAAWPRAAWSDGYERYAASVSTWPVSVNGMPLHRFLRFPGELLSLKATAGFFARARNSRLRFPDGFLDAVEVHLNRMKTHEGALWEEGNEWSDSGPRDVRTARAHSAVPDQTGTDRPQ